MKEMKIIEGAKNILSKGLQIEKNDKLIVLTHEKCIPSAEYLVRAAKLLSVSDVLMIQLPEILRPVTKVPKTLSGAITEADALIYAIDRIPEEHQQERKIHQLCADNECKYCNMYDVVPRYLGEAINADYNIVTQKCEDIAHILKESIGGKIEVKTDLGTSLSFNIYDSIRARGPIFGGSLHRQAPEGEVSTCPVENTFQGKLVVDGAITYMGVPETPITLMFNQGRVVDVAGDDRFLSNLLRILKLLDGRLESLLGISIAEFSVGANDWAILDENVSNCEKVSGTIHFGIGKTTPGGIDRGEKFHFDSIVTKSTVHVTKKNGERVCLIDSGHLQ